MRRRLLIDLGVLLALVVSLSQLHLITSGGGLGGGLALGALAVALLLWCRRPLTSLATLLRREAWARQDLLLASGLFALALFLRVWGNSGCSLPGEEALLSAARSSMGLLLAGDLSSSSWQWSRGAPLGAALVYSPATLFADALMAGRVLSALFGALTAALLFVAGREIFGRGVALVAGLITVVLPPLVAAGREVSVEGVASLCYLLTVWFFWRGCSLWRAVIEAEVEGEQEHALSARRAFWGAGLALGSTLALQLAGLSVVVVVLAIFFGVLGGRLFRRGALRFPGALVALPALALFAALLWQPGLWTRPLTGFAEQLLAANAATQPLSPWEPLLWLTSRAPIWLWLFALGGAMRALGLFSSRQKVSQEVWRRRVGGALAVLWLLAPLSAATLTGLRGGDALHVSQWVTPALLALCLLAASGVEAMARIAASALRRDDLLRGDLRRSLMAFGGGALLLLLFVGVLGFHPHLAAYHSGWPLRGEGMIQARRRQRAAHGALDEAMRYVARAARSGEEVALDTDLIQRIKGGALPGRADVKLIELKMPLTHGAKAPHWLISATIGGAPMGYGVAKALRAGDSVLLRVFRRRDPEDGS
ncbi:MAG: glycosyltransferase family 39 protein [Deltaproteobacteria bacterium]|nr:glycosyltransferase family 39 protein [Deltaproteobacteria bacterium]